MTVSMSSTGSRWGALGYRKVEDGFAMGDERMERWHPAKEMRRVSHVDFPLLSIWMLL